MQRKVRTLRHWKQRFNKNAKFVWRRSLTFQGKRTKIGDEIPDTLADNPTKLRRFWESSVIELAEFEDPDVTTGQVAEVETPEPEKQGNSKWSIEGLDEVFKTKKAAKAAWLEEAERDKALLGSSILASEYEIVGITVTLGDIVIAAFEKTETSKDEWNALDDAVREELLAETLLEMQDADDDDIDDGDAGDADDDTSETDDGDADDDTSETDDGTPETDDGAEAETIVEEENDDDWLDEGGQ